MRKNLFLLTMASALLTLSSCKKVWDYVKDHPNGTADNCKIDKIYFTATHFTNLAPLETYLFRDTANFKYNSKGLLTSIDYAYNKNTPINENSSINYAFSYDNKGRLSTFFEFGNFTNNGSIVGLWGHKYAYVTDKLIHDSLFTYASGVLSTNGEVTMYGIPGEVTSIILDDWGRIIKYGNTAYNYDASGNLISTGITYTSKKSIFQTDKTLMFITRNYSVNAPVNFAYQFNSNQLPAKINTGKIPFFTYDSQTQLVTKDEDIEVKYQCK